MANQKEQLSMKDRLSKQILRQQVRQEEIDPVDELASIVPDSMVDLIPTDEETIKKQVSVLEQFFFAKYNLKYQKPGGRPAKIQSENVTKLVKLLGLGYSVREACQACGFSYMAYYRFLDLNPNFRDSFDQVKEEYLAYLSRRNLATLLMEGDKDATFKWLEANDPRYNRKPVNVSNTTNNNLVLEITPDRAVQIMESLKKKKKILEEGEYGTITRTRPHPNS